MSYTKAFDGSIAEREVHFNATFTVDTFGYVSNSVFKGNIRKDEIEKINYYLSRLSNLVPFQKNGVKQDADIHINFFSRFDTVRVGNDVRTNCSYIAYSEDTILGFVKAQQLIEEDYEKIFIKAEKEPSFPGGENAWIRFLQQNLKPNVAADDGAPPGVYTVEVQFIVDAQGKVTEVRPIKVPAKCPSCGTEAVRVIKKGPKWEAAIQNGKPVTFRKVQAINFVVQVSQ
jgi:hypothetical protein